MWKPLARDVEAADNDHKSKLGTSAKLESDIPKYEQLKTRMNKLSHMLDEQESALPTEAELPAFFETLNRKVLESGVEVKTTQRGAEAKVESFIRVPVDFEITGTFMQLKKFFASLTYRKHKAGASASDGGGDDDRERIVSIDNLVLNDPEVVNHELVLHAKFTANTYREELKEGTATAAPAHAAAPAPPPAPATKTMPPADTPAGAKARAEDAMDKDEKRTRNAPSNPAETGSGSNKLKGGM
jgi:Tfp pilus assembly protein PilO